MPDGGGKRCITAVVFRESLLAMVSKPLPLIMLVVLLVMSSAILNVQSAVEYYHAQPYRAMKADCAITVEPDDDDLLEVVDGVSSAIIVGYEVIVENDAKAVEVSVSGVRNLSDNTLAYTQFNKETTGCEGVDGDSALMDSSLAKTLGVSVGDVVSVSQRLGSESVSVEITGLYPAWGSAQGLLVDNKQLEDFAPSSATYYPADSPDALLDSLGGNAEIVTRQDFIDIAHMRAHSILPGFLTDVMQWGAALLSLAGGLFFAAIVLKALQKDLYFPLRCLGYRRRESLRVFFASGAMVFLACEAIAALASLLLFNAAYHAVFSLAQIAGTFVVGIVPAIVGLIVTALSARDDVN